MSIPKTLHAALTLDNNSFFQPIPKSVFGNNFFFHTDRISKKKSTQTSAIFFFTFFNQTQPTTSGINLHVSNFILKLSKKTSLRDVPSTESALLKSGIINYYFNFADQI